MTTAKHDNGEGQQQLRTTTGEHGVAGHGERRW